MIELEVNTEWKEIEGARYEQVTLEEYKVTIPIIGVIPLDTFNGIRIRIDGCTSRQVLGEDAISELGPQGSTGQIQLRVLI